jgi:uncharacterized protein YeaO (DUF488 family)
MIKVKRWNDPVADDDGFRLLICRYRPRALRKADETWKAWWKVLGPSKHLHASFYCKHGPPPPWEVYRDCYLAEMSEAEPQAKIAELAERVMAGETITLLCSSACVDAQSCHRTLLKGLIEARLS